jgi:hypothetical protein
VLVEFWILNTNGTLRCPLPDVETWAISPIANDAGSITFTYPADGVNWSVLHEAVTVDKDLSVQVRIDGVIQPDLQATISESSGDDVEEGSVWSYTGVLALGRLSEAVVEPQSGMPSQGEDSPTENDGHYYSCTAGTLFATLMAEANARAALTDITYSFTGTHDSNGTSWSKIITLKLTPGTDYLKVGQALVEAGMCEMRMYGKDLRLYEPEWGTDRTLTNPPVIFYQGQNVLDSPRKHSVRDTATSVLVAGSDGVYKWADDAAALTRRGRRIEIGVSQGQISDPTTLDAYAQHFLSGASTGRMEKTHGLTLADGPIPMRDFAVGDWVWSDLGSGRERLRVAQWTLSQEADGAQTGSVTLNDLFADQMAALARRLQGISGGTTITGTSNARDIPADVTDGVPPAVPNGITVASVAYTTTENVTLAAVTVTWDPVTFNSDGTGLTDLGYYTAYWRYQDTTMHPTLDILSWISAGSTNDNFANFSAVRPGVWIDVRVGATDAHGNFSGWSPIVQHLTAKDNNAPPVPSAPLMTSLLGAVRIEWDGKGQFGEAMPADFRHVEVHVSTVDNFIPTNATLYDTVLGAAALGYTKGAYGVSQFARFIAVDTSNNKSNYSADSTAIPRQILNPDIANLSIGSAQIMDLDVGKVTSGILNAAVTLSGEIATASSGPRFGMNSSEFFAWDTNGVKTVSITNQGAASFLGEIRTATTGARIVINPGGLAPAEMRFYPTNNTLGKYVSLFTSDIPGQAPGYSLVYLKGDRFSGLAGEAVLRMWYYEAAFGWFDSTADLLSSTESAVYARQYSAGMNGSRLLFVAHGLRDQPVHEFAFTTDSGTQGVGLGQFFRDSDNAFIMACPAKGSAICLQGNWIYAVAAGNTSLHVGFTASTVTQSSGIATKTNIADIDHDVLAVLESAPSKRWQYRADHQPSPKPKPLRRHKLLENGEPTTELIDIEPFESGLPIHTHWGPMAEDLPEGVRIYTPADPDQPHIDHGSFMGLQWAVLRELHARVKTQDAEIKSLKTRLGK